MRIPFRSLSPSINRVLSLLSKARKIPTILFKTNNVVACIEVGRGIYRCGDNYKSKLVAFYTITDVGIRLEELELIDIVTHLKKLVNALVPPGCSIVTLSKIEPVNVDKFLSAVNTKLQMKLVELEQDKANTRLRSSLEKLMETRKKVLSGITPVTIENIVAVMCDDLELYREQLKKIPKIAEHVLNIKLKAVKNPQLASYITNFRL